MFCFVSLISLSHRGTVVQLFSENVCLRVYSLITDSTAAFFFFGKLQQSCLLCLLGSKRQRLREETRYQDMAGQQ
ncbi:hypothetical protein ANANG_G00319140 [Anguilla anguilla]|uniref:Uncharacterized protein n=1 Tax=Anguilla anguilla TaxID=7936 RepID=A0A9D3RH30_ANGAN|nr:hypothetical protein ANANG_G00319140 [Anguilla anguilla]